MPVPGNQLWDRDYKQAIFSSPGASLVPTNVQLSPRSQAFVAENNDILLKRKGDRFLRRSRSKSWSRSPSPHGRSSYKNGRRFSPRKRSLSNSSGESPSGRKYSRKNPRPQSSEKHLTDEQKKETPKRRGGSPISFVDSGLGSKKDNNNHKEPQKITLNRNRIIQISSSKNNSTSNSNSRPVWNRTTNRNQSSNSNPSVSKTKEEEKKEEKPQQVESKPAEPSSTTTPAEVKKPVEVKKPPPVKPPRQKTAEELMEEELLRSDDELDDGILLTNDDLNIDDLFESESESENEGRFKSKPTNSKDSPISFSKLAEKSVAKIRPLDDVIEKGGSRSRGYDKKDGVSNNFSRKSGQNDKKSEKKPLEFRKLALDRKKGYGEFFG